MFGMEEWLNQDVIVSYAIKLIAALLVFIIGKWLAKKLAALFIVVLERNNIDATLTKFLRNIVYYALLTLVVIAAAGQLGINTTSFLTVVGAAGLAIGLALKDSLSNFASGVMLILFRPFRVGDAVTVAGETGSVEEITVFSTILTTPDNQRKILPNSMVASAAITNITANPTRRIDMVFGIGYDDDLRQAEQILREVVQEDSRVLSEPAVTIAVAELADSSVNFVVRPWVKTGDYWAVRFSLIEKIKLALDEAGISIPYPQQDVHMHQAVDSRGDSAA